VPAETRPNGRAPNPTFRDDAAVPYVPGVFGSLSIDEFLERHWQRAPLFVPGALPGFRSPLSPDELAGLACEENVESRLVQGRLGGKWRLEHGPFEEERFERLPKRDWTLLVQDVDKLLPELNALLQPFRFIPDWRIDDIMISFAAPGGSVGPHTDQYDVFLLQAQGRRRWQLSERFDPALVAGADLKILQHFTPEREFVAEPGDLLYLPPNVAHFGVALDEALTFSIGFRAPDQRELMLAFCDELSSRAEVDRRFVDPGRPRAQSPLTLSEADLAQFRTLLRSGLEVSDSELDRFTGRYLTRPKPNLQPEVEQGGQSSPALVQSRLEGGGKLVRPLESRYAILPDNASLTLFADGETYALSSEHLVWLERLATGTALERTILHSHPGALPHLVELLSRGSLEWQEDEP
jgi:50S ribosomal protein L16 3-hydroxylase